MIQFKNDSVTVFQSALYQTTSSVIETKDAIFVVDPNWLPAEVEYIQDYTYSLKGERPLYLIFTHSDWDHILGYGAFKGAKVIASKSFNENPEKARIIEQINQFDDDYYLMRNYEISYPEVDVVINEDGQIIEIGETKLTFYFANGHTNDGLFTFIEPLDIFLAGDYLSDVEFPFIYDSTNQYEQTLQKAKRIIDQYEVKLLIPGHGTVTDDRAEMIKRIRESENYIKETKEAVYAGIDNKSDSLIEVYPFKRNMKKMHEANRKLMKEELLHQNS